MATCRGIVAAGEATLSVAAVVSRFDTAHHPEFTTAPVNRAARPAPRQVQPCAAPGCRPDPERGRDTVFVRPARAARPGALWLGAGSEAGSSGAAGMRRLPSARRRRISPGGRQSAIRTGRLPDRPAPTCCRSFTTSTAPPAIRCAFDANVPDKQVRHGLAPAELVGELRQFYAAQAVTADPALLRQFVPPRPLPDQSAGPSEQRFDGRHRGESPDCREASLGVGPRRGECVGNKSFPWGGEAVSSVIT